MNLKNLSLLLATLTTTLTTGVFVAFCVTVNTALGRLPDAVYLEVMQHINVDIVNPAFIFIFAGGPLFLGLTVLVHSRKPLSPRFLLICAAALIYILGSFVVTVFGNIPLNDKLAVFSIHEASVPAIKTMRQGFEGPWNSWHMVRTAAGVIAAVLLVRACQLNEHCAV